MKVVILQADTVAADLRPRHCDYPEMFMRLFAQAGLNTAELQAINAATERLPGRADADAYVITASRHSVYDPLPWIQPLADFVGLALASGRRVLAICFGHQLLAHYFGGAVTPSSSGWRVGVQRNQLLDGASQVLGLEPQGSESVAREFSVIASHQDQVTILPPGAQRLASHRRCPNAAYFLPHASGGCALALQDHPEFDKAYIRALMENRRERLGEARYAEGIASLAYPTTHGLVARWLANFLIRGVSNE